MSQLFASGGQNIEVSVSASVLPMNMIFYRTDWFDLLAIQGTPKSPPAPQFKSINSLAFSLLYDPTLAPNI